MNLVRFTTPRVPAGTPVAVKANVIRAAARSVLLGCLCFPSLGITPATALAAWLANGTPIWHDKTGVDTNTLTLSMIPDGAGGVYLVSGGGLFDSRLNRIRESGDLAPGWPQDGIYFSAGPWWPFVPTAIPADDGGAFLLSDAMGCGGNNCRGNSSEVRVQRVTPDAQIASGWPAEGVSTGSGPDRTTAGFDQRQATPIPNGKGAVVMTWARRQSILLGPSPAELRAQLIDGNGALPWGSDGVLVHPFRDRRYDQAMAPDGMGGAYVFWLDDRAPGLFGQHISEQGKMLWATNGIPIAMRPSTFVGRPVAITDGSHGAIVAWAGSSGARTGVFAVRVSPSGALPWRGRGEVFDAGSLRVDGLRVIKAPSGGAVLAWRAWRQGADVQILAQHLNHEGRRLWAPGGAPVCQAGGSRDKVALATDHRGGAYLAWVDSRPEFSVYGAHLDSDGALVRGWPKDGAPVCARLPFSFASDATADVSELAISTLEAPGVRSRDESALESIGADDLASPDLVHGHESPDDTEADEHGSRGGRRDAGAIVAWVDSRRQACTDCNFEALSPFAMLLTPHGPATAPVTPPLAPISVNQPDYSQAPANARGLSLAMSSTGVQTVSLSLEGATPALLEVFDVGGRKLWAREIGGLGTGVHEVRLGDGETYPSGVYMARLTQGNHMVTAHVAVIH